MMPLPAPRPSIEFEMTDAAEPPGGLRGILAGVDRLEVSLHAVLVLLTLTSALRYVDGHGLGDDAPAVLTGAFVLLAVYALFPRSARTRGWSTVWLAALLVVWLVLVLLAPSFAWCAVPLSFVALRVLPFAAACAVVAGMVLVVVVAWTSMQGELDPTIVTGPACIAVLAVLAYRALERDAVLRQRLLEDLRDAQGDLADAQHRTGALAERARLSREIHDSVAQGLSSINLLLQAAQQDWDARPVSARAHVGQAAMAARDGLDEVRRVVRDLAPAELSGEDNSAALVEALELLCARTTTDTGIDVQLHVHGAPQPLPPEVATALQRTARGALANVVEHAAASSAAVTLTYQQDCVSLDVRDDGRGFEPAAVSSALAHGRGRGLAGIRRRIEQFRGGLAIESAPGEGTALAASIPLPDRR